MLSLNQSSSNSTCHYLFGKEASEIFTHLTISNRAEIGPFVDQCLDLSLRVNVYLLTHKDGFFLIDPMAFNNQCHLYALRVAQIKRTYQAKKEEEKFAKTEENRFLHLSFFLNYSFLCDKKLYVEVYREVMQKLLVKSPLPEKTFLSFLKDGQRCREKAARLALNSLFKTYMQEILAKDKYENALAKELYLISFEDLQMASSRGPEEGILYTYPHFAGVAYMVDRLMKENLIIAIKVKVITKDGAAGTIIQTSAKPEMKSDPVLVFEAMATDGSYSLIDCREKAKACPTYFYRYSAKNLRHKEEETCFFCKKVSIDLKPFNERIQIAMKSVPIMFYALSSDFILQKQPDFKIFFENKEKYPALTNIFNTSIPKIKELGLEMNNPITFSICHTYTDSAYYALSEKLRLDTVPKKFLKQREII